MTEAQEWMKTHSTPFINAILIDYMGSDKTVVNSARVSYSNDKPLSNVLNKKDEKLIHYLAEHKHMSPFNHCFATFKCQAPIFVARQLVKHQIGLIWNEVSRRYVSNSPNFWRVNT